MSNPNTPPLSDDLIYQISICDVPYIGHVYAKMLCEQFGGAREVFQARQSDLEKIEGFGYIRARSIKKYRSFDRAEKEIAFIQRYNISPLFFLDSAYPKRLLNCYDPPVLLYYKGNADLNAKKIVSIVGTRRHSDYGNLVVDRLMQAFQHHNALIISGLAFGIDASAHKTAIRYRLPTVGVVAHGLDRIYPSEHSSLAREMVKNGGLITEFGSKTNPDRHNFPSHNRVIAGISDATIVIETGTRGGSIITAELAAGYHRDVFAIPGRITDSKSSGCNDLIKNSKAQIVTDVAQLPDLLGWEMKTHFPVSRPINLFAHLGENEMNIIDLLRKQECVSIDELMQVTNLAPQALSAALLTLEINKITQILPGKRYSLML